ncbi:MAG TPA: hypothetical protein VM491_18865 [Burkholderiaceae bacterium]|nr:hypothetical protein [Burkholderiaceae bacterium]
MEPVDGIRKHGFRKWYERKLIESHLYLVAFLLALLMVGSGMELILTRVGTADLFIDVALIAGGGALAWHAWRRYATLMLVAQQVSRQAECPGCKRFGFALDPDEAVVRRAIAHQQLAARCRKCGRGWQIDAAD